MEGIRLWKSVPDSKLVLSGGTFSPRKMATGLGMALLARELGVPQDAIVLESRSWDTTDEARLLKPILGENKFALVTSAYHMRRAVLTFKRMGLDPNPRAGGFHDKGGVSNTGRYLPAIPNGHGLVPNGNTPVPRDRVAVDKGAVQVINPGVRIGRQIFCLICLPRETRAHCEE